MRIYFAASEQASENFQKRFTKIVELLHAAGITVISNLVSRHATGFSQQDLERIDESGEGMIEQVDGIIIENSKPIAESGYLVAIALTHKKPILYLTEKGRPDNKNLAQLKKEPTAAKLLMLESYTDKELEKIVIDFLQLVEQGTGREMASIKFTLRITKRIERYLQWKTHNTSTSKADYLRHIIEDLISNDKDYQRFIRDKDER